MATTADNNPRLRGSDLPNPPAATAIGTQAQRVRAVLSRTRHVRAWISLRVRPTK